LKFHTLNEEQKDKIKNLLKSDHARALSNCNMDDNSIDSLIIKHLFAININENVNKDDDVLIGALWRNIFWLCKDIGNEKFAKICAYNALEKLRKVLDKEQINDNSKGYIALNVVALLKYMSMDEYTDKYLSMACISSDVNVRRVAFILKTK
jgi:hypothetical protein